MIELELELELELVVVVVTTKLLLVESVEDVTLIIFVLVVTGSELLLEARRLEEEELPLIARLEDGDTLSCSDVDEPVSALLVPELVKRFVDVASVGGCWELVDVVIVCCEMPKDVDGVLVVLWVTLDSVVVDRMKLDTLGCVLLTI